MFYYIQGKITIKKPEFIVLDLNGIGFKIFVSKKTLENLSIKKDAKIFTDHNIKHEEKIEIYGFLTEKELELFQFLKKISGIGPKASLSLSASGSFENLQQKLSNNDTSLFDGLKGVGGKKTQRILLELENKTLKKKVLKKIKDSDRDIVDGLLSMGFSKSDILIAISRVSKNIKNKEKKTKEILKILGTKK